MQNKKTSIRFQKCFSNSTYYRSVKYRVNKTTISEPQSLSKISRNRNHTTIDESHLSNGKVTKFKRYSTINNQQQQKKMSYLQTWRTLLQTIQLKGPDCKIQSKTETVRLPIIRQQEKSLFTMLNPLPLPIQFIKDEIITAKANLCLSQQQINKMRAQMVIMRTNIERQLDTINDQITNSIGRIRQAIVLDQIKQQQMRLRARRQCKALSQGKVKLNQILQANKLKINSLQQLIFEGKPFQLQKVHENQTETRLPTYF